MTLEQERSHEVSFRCEMCGSPTDIINSLPIKQPDGRLNTLACDECAEKSGAFCITHQRPHLLGFEDGTTACNVCIDEQVKADTPEIVNKFHQKINRSPHKERTLEELRDWSDFLSKTLGLSYGDNVSRAIITVALRFHKTPDEIIEQVCEEGPEVILPWSERD